MNRQKLFEHMQDEHGLTLLESEMQEIEKIIEKDEHGNYKYPAYSPEPTKYLPEVCIGQKYLIEGETFVLFDIRATNVDSPTDFIIACRFKSEKSFFEENIKNVIGNEEFKLIT